MRKIFFILIGVISAAFAIYFFACSTIETFKIKVPGSSVKVRSAKQVVNYPLPLVRTVVK